MPQFLHGALHTVQFRDTSISARRKTQRAFGD